MVFFIPLKVFISFFCTSINAKSTFVLAGRILSIKSAYTFYDYWMNGLGTVRLSIS